MAEKIVMWIRPTPGDHRFYERWQEVGEIIDLAQPAQATVLVTDHHYEVTEDILSQMPKLRFVVSPNTGHTHLKFDPEARGIKIVSLKGESAFLTEVRSVSEFTMGLILNLARPVHGGVGMLLNNKTLGIVGLGRIGKQLSILASAFGMRVTHVDKDSPDWAWFSLFQRSDFVSIHLPEAPDTAGKVGRSLLSRMKPSAFLINTARPSVLDECALAECVAQEKIAGAALDVTDRDWSAMPQVLVTPHCAGFTLEDRVKTDEFVLEKLKATIGPRRVREHH